MTPVEKYNGAQEEITLCEAVVKGSGTLLILIANTRNKTIKVPRCEELGHALPLRNISRVESVDRKNSQYRGTEVKEDGILAPEGYRNRATWLVRANRDILANSDKK